VAVASCVKNDAETLVIGYLTLVICLLNPVDEISLMVGLPI
jgi:hypothetical protein